MISNLIYQQINNITISLIKEGLSIEQNFPSSRSIDGKYIVSFQNDNNICKALKNETYKVIYDKLEKTKSYNIKLIDGALIQFMYICSREKLLSHRLAYMPSPFIEAYKNAQEIYGSDLLYGDIVRDSITPFPIRFDYSENLQDFKEFYHSKSHLTLGEFDYCRIPVIGPVNPYSFISFILKHFYIEDRLDEINKKIYAADKIKFPASITEKELKEPHFCIY